MTTISIKSFAGEIPRVPAHMLPDNNASYAMNCNFAYGELRPMKGGFLMTSLANAAKSIFTTNGLTFYSWATKTRAYKGPVSGDIYNRMYYANDVDGFRVAYTTGTTTNGGVPATSYKVGVPRPTTALTYVLKDLTSLRDYPNAQVKIYSFYSDNGRRYEEKEVTSFTTTTAFRKYTINGTIAKPTTNASTAAGATSGTTLALSSFTYMASVVSGTAEFMQPATVNTAGATVTIIDGTTLVYNSTTYYNVTSMTPVTGVPTTPGTTLEETAASSGVTPSSAVLGFRLDIVDSVKNTTILTLNATVGDTSPRSDAVPGGVELVVQSIAGNGAVTGYTLSLNYGIMETRAYVATLVNQQAEESQPSDAIVVQPTYMQSVQITLTPPSTAGYVPVNKCRFYRTVADGTYLSVGPAVTLNTPTTVFTDDYVTITDTEATLETQQWMLPPTNLKGLTLCANGFFAGFVGDTLYFSEPYAPWAWPYKQVMPYPIVGIRPTDSGILVTTNSFPYAVVGAHPSAMSQVNLSASQAGVTDYGMAQIGNSVAFVGYDGIVMVNGNAVDVETFQKFHTRETWKNAYGSVLQFMELSYYDGGLIVTSPIAGTCFEIRIDEAAGALSRLDSSFRADALFVLPATDQLYYVSGNQLYQYKGGSTISYDWRSKDFILPKPINFGAGFIRVESGPVTLTVYANGVQWGNALTFDPSSPSYTGYFRLPGGSKALKWSVKLTGTGTVKELHLAERMEELKVV